MLYSYTNTTGTCRHCAGTDHSSHDCGGDGGPRRVKPGVVNRMYKARLAREAAAAAAAEPVPEPVPERKAVRA